MPDRFVVRYKTVLRPWAAPHRLLGSGVVSGIASNTGDHDYYVEEYQLIDRGDFCCEAMSEAWRNGALAFGSVEGNRDNQVNFFLCYLHPDGASWQEYAIHFCPFCATPVETVEVKRVKLVAKRVVRKVVETTYDEEEP